MQPGSAQHSATVERQRRRSGFEGSIFAFGLSSSSFFFFFFFGARHHHIQTRGCTDCMRACHRLRYLLFGAKKQTDTIIELQSPKLEHRLLGQAFSKVIATSGCIIYQITALKIQPKANITNTVDLSSVYPMYSLQMGSYRE